MGYSGLHSLSRSFSGDIPLPPNPFILLFGRQRMVENSGDAVYDALVVSRKPKIWVLEPSLFSKNCGSLIVELWLIGSLLPLSQLETRTSKQIS